MENEVAVSKNFIEEIIERDIANGFVPSHIHTRFPPEPNGYMHIGHLKAIYINFYMAQKYGGKCNLRFDDTNPVKEDVEYVDSIMRDIRWLGFDWEDRLYFASEYFDTYYEVAVRLIKNGLAYVDHLAPEEMREYRGTLTQPGKNSPYRNRSVEENLALFEQMKAGDFAEGTCILRAKIDMTSPNINMRDPALYRILHTDHHHVGSGWCIYPMYDYAHPLEDAIEGITHSFCSFEFEDHHPLYNWVVEHSGLQATPHQYEFARLNITRTVLSKRFLRSMVESGSVDGWDDPRMPTVAGMRRRGFTPEAILDFIARAGISKANSVVDYALLEHCVREDLNEKAPRAMAILNPLKITITNYPEGEWETVVLENHPNHPEMGERTLSFGRELYMEREDFMLVPARKFFRLFPGNEVRLKGSYIIKCEEAVLDDEGNVTELLCTYDPLTKSGMPGASRKIKGTLHWLSAKDAVPAKARLYDFLLDENEEKPYNERVTPNSKIELKALVEPMLAGAKEHEHFQFLRNGYFVVDSDSTADMPVFNRTVGLRDTWGKISAKEE